MSFLISVEMVFVIMARQVTFGGTLYIRSVVLGDCVLFTTLPLYLKPILSQTAFGVKTKRGGTAVSLLGMWEFGFGSQSASAAGWGGPSSGCFARMTV